MTIAITPSKIGAGPLARDVAYNMPMIGGAFDNPDDADVVLQFVVDAGHDASDAALPPPPPKLFHLHAVVLRSESAYLRARLSKAWESDVGVDTGSSVRFRIVEHIEDDAQLVAAERLLRLMYGLQLPDALAAMELLDILLVADRFVATRCADLVMALLSAALAQKPSRMSCPEIAAVSERMCALPPDCLSAIDGGRGLSSLLRGALDLAVHKLEAAQAAAAGSTTGATGQTARTVDVDVVRAAVQRLAVRMYGDVSDVVRNGRTSDFRALPFAVVEAWAESDALQVTSENDVAYLLNEWVSTNLHRMKGTARQQHAQQQATRLAQLVRVQHLGPAYRHQMTRKLPLFQYCDQVVLGSAIAMGCDIREATRKCEYLDFVPPTWIDAVPRMSRADSSEDLTIDFVDGYPHQVVETYLNGFDVSLTPHCRDDYNTVPTSLDVSYDVGDLWPGAVHVGEVTVRLMSLRDAGVPDVIHVYPPSLTGDGTLCFFENPRDIPYKMTVVFSTIDM